MAIHPAQPRRGPCGPSGRAPRIRRLERIAVACFIGCGGCAHAPPAPPADARAAGTTEGPSKAQEVAEKFLDALSRQDFATGAAYFTPDMAAAMSVADLQKLWKQIVDAEGEWSGVDQYSTVTNAAATVVQADVWFSRRRQRFLVPVNADGKVTGFFRGPVPEDAARSAVDVVQALGSGNGDALERALDEKMRSAWPASKAMADWQAATSRSGSLQSVDGVSQASERGLVVAFVRCRMEKGLLTVKVVFDPDGEVGGFFFVPNSAAAGWTPPPYARANAFEERPMQVGSAPALPGLLAMPVQQATGGPDRAAACPAVVLVHGSGPNDRDETVGGTKVFRDLAFGLASRGIAVLRYHKRTLAMPIVVLQAERDYQVTVQDDFAGWRAALATDPHAMLKSYPLLDHRFVECTAPSTPEQYFGSGHVDAQIIEDIASWLASLRK